MGLSESAETALGVCVLWQWSNLHSLVLELPVKQKKDECSPLEEWMPLNCGANTLLDYWKG